MIWAKSQMICNFIILIGPNINIVLICKLSFHNDLAPLLELTDVTFCPCHVCVSLYETIMDISVALHYIIILHIRTNL